MASKVLLVGTVINDPQSRNQLNGHALTVFKVKTTTRVSEKFEVCIHSIVTFGKTAESCRDHLEKGELVFIDGRLKYGRDEKAEIVAERVEFVRDDMDAGEKNYRAEDWR
jgi:single-strand DNA-binding protein